MHQSTSFVFSVTAALTGGALLLLAPAAHADDVTVADERRMPAKAGEFSLKLEPGVALPLGSPQWNRFNVGGGQTLKGLWALNEYVDIGPSATFMALPVAAAPEEVGTAWTLGGGGRFKRPHHVAGSAISPWIDADLLYVRTGELNRPGFAAAVGLALPVGAARVLWLGPFVRYLHVVQGARSGFDDRDAKVLSLGVSLEVGHGVKREPAALPVSEAGAAHTETFFCPDRDKDDVPDRVDRCPDVAGRMNSWGCPEYEKLVIKPDKLELKEKLYFGWDQAVLQEQSYPVLDEVVKALNDNKNFRVQVEGHASAEGADDHNQALSEKRANAVLEYLVVHGIDKERLVSKGLSSSVPLDTNETAAGRENNRRVEFVVNFTILDGGIK